MKRALRAWAVSIGLAAVFAGTWFAVPSAANAARYGVPFDDNGEIWTTYTGAAAGWPSNDSTLSAWGYARGYDPEELATLYSMERAWSAHYGEPGDAGWQKLEAVHQGMQEDGVDFGNMVLENSRWHAGYLYVHTANLWPLWRWLEADEENWAGCSHTPSNDGRVIYGPVPVSGALPAELNGTPWTVPATEDEWDALDEMTAYAGVDLGGAMGEDARLDFNWSQNGQCFQSGGRWWEQVTFTQIRCGICSVMLFNGQAHSYTWETNSTQTSSNGPLYVRIRPDYNPVTILDHLETHRTLIEGDLFYPTGVAPDGLPELMALRAAEIEQADFLHGDTTPTAETGQEPMWQDPSTNGGHVWWDGGRNKLDDAINNALQSVNELPADAPSWVRPLIDWLTTPLATLIELGGYMARTVLEVAEWLVSLPVRLFLPNQSRFMRELGDFRAQVEDALRNTLPTGFAFAVADFYAAWEWEMNNGIHSLPAGTLDLHWTTVHYDMHDWAAGWEQYRPIFAGVVYVSFFMSALVIIRRAVG